MISEIVWTISGGIFDVADKESSLEDINNQLSDESTWSNLELSQSLNKEKADLEKDDIDLFIFHQASAVILRQLKLKLNIPDEKWFQNIKNMGNTVSATIPIAIKQSIDSGLYKPNMKIMLMGFGVGLSVAGCIIRS